ncbi:hypothetical protein ACIRPX_10080 [Streptomyces sp. NPDC101225]|uniref:hypothetical protein n=1 Tax=Streptomyces sp. NPDC101225 TaxID=3366135 RepID=UPI0038155BCB
MSAHGCRVVYGPDTHRRPEHHRALPAPAVGSTAVVTGHTRRAMRPLVNQR